MVQGTTSYKVACKLKYLKNDIKLWAKEEIRKEGEEANLLFFELGDLDFKEGRMGLQSDELARRDKIKLMMARKAKMDELA